MTSFGILMLSAYTFYYNKINNFFFNLTIKAYVHRIECWVYVHVLQS